MSGGVALRCPTCGTTQSHRGECEACSEGEVRYFCSNHNPGLWLDAPVCTACGAELGAAPSRPAEATVAGAAPTVSRRRTRPDLPPPLPRGGGTPSPGMRPSTGVKRSPPKAADPEDTAVRPSLEDVLVDMLEEGERTRPPVEEAPWRERMAAAPRTSFPFVGCLVRLLLFVLLIIALAIFGLFLLMGGAFQGFIGELGLSAGLMAAAPTAHCVGV